MSIALRTNEMKFLLILLNVALIRGGVIKENDEDCPGVIVNGIYHDMEELKRDLDRPYQLAVDYSPNILYFSYTLNSEDDIFKSAYIELNTKVFGNIEGVHNGFTHTVDQKTHEVYIGGSKGIFKYNHTAKSAEYLGEEDTDVWNMYFKDVLYYSNFPSQFLYTYVNNETRRFKDLEDTKVDQFVIDNEDIMFFTNSTGLFGQKKGTKDSILYKEYPTNGPRGLAVDLSGDVYVCMFDGIYKINKAETSVDKILDTDDAFGLAFDNENNIIYSDATKLIRLKPNKEKAC